MSLAGKVVLVAGASSGMGRATAKAAAEEGAKVVLFARREKELDELVREIGADVTSFVGDATDQAHADQAVRHAVDTFGRLDVLVNSVGTNIKKRALADLTAEGWRSLIATNLDAAFVLTQATLPIIREQQAGLLIHISSVGAKRADRSGAGYQAAKAGVAALAHATMEEERANGLRVTVIYPGLTDTALVEQRPVPPTKEELTKALQPEDIAHLCLAVMTMPDRAHVSEIVVYPTQS